MVDDRSLQPEYSAAMKPTRVFRAARIILEYAGILHALCQRLDSRPSMANSQLISQSGQDARAASYPVQIEISAANLPSKVLNLDRIARGACIRLGRRIPQNNAEFSAEFS